MAEPLPKLTVPSEVQNWDADKVAVVPDEEAKKKAREAQQEKALEQGGFVKKGERLTESPTSLPLPR